MKSRRGDGGDAATRRKNVRSATSPCLVSPCPRVLSFHFMLHPSAFILKLIMLTHIVVWKYRTEIEPELRADHVDRLRNLATIIKEVESLAVGFDTLHLSRSFDTGLVAIFRDRAALD